jgi:hypothetical protein
LLKAAAKWRSNRNTGLVEVGRTAEHYREVVVLLYALKGRSAFADERKEGLFAQPLYTNLAVYGCLYGLDPAFNFNLIRCLVLMDRSGVSDGVVFFWLSPEALARGEERRMGLFALYKR